MRQRRRFKIAGSLAAATISAVSAALWIEEEFPGFDPDEPRLSDPDSDALYSLSDKDNSARDSMAQTDNDLPSIVETPAQADPSPPPDGNQLADAVSQDQQAPAVQPTAFAGAETSTLDSENVRPIVIATAEGPQVVSGPAIQPPIGAPEKPDRDPQLDGNQRAGAAALEELPPAALAAPAANHLASNVVREADKTTPEQSLLASGPATFQPSPMGDLALRDDQPTNPIVSRQAPPLPEPAAAPSKPPGNDQVQAGPTNASTGQPDILALAAILNNTPSDKVLTVERAADGRLTALAGELRALRLKIDPTIGDNEKVALATLPGLSARYVESSQSLAINAPDALLVPTQVDAGGQSGQPIGISDISTQPGFLLNYRLSTTSQRGDGRDFRSSGELEFVGTSGPALLVTNGFFSADDRRGFVRGDSFFRVEDIKRVRTYTLGDFATSALGFTSSVRLGGIQVQSNFEQRPDLYTGPLPQFAGSAALPSAVDLFVDRFKIFTANVPQGPFVLRSLPSILGNSLRIVTTDPTGRETEVTIPYFDAPGLLRKGITEFSVEAGAPRVDAGVRSFGYLNKLFASGSLRYGLGDRTTIEGHGEAGDGLVNGGLGIIRALGPLGSFTLGASASGFKGNQGARITGRYRFTGRRFSAFATVEREYGNYFDLGDISRQRRNFQNGFPVTTFPEHRKRSSERFGATFSPAFDPFSLTVAYNRVRIGNDLIRTADVGFNRRITDRISFNGSAIVDLRDRDRLAVLAGLSFRLGRNVRAFAGGENRNGRSSYRVSVDGFTSGEQNALGYQFRQTGDENGEAARAASVNYRFAQALVTGTVEQDGKNVRGTFGLEGSIVASGGGTFLANRVGESFAIVTNAGPHTNILQNGRRIAKANGRGRALLANIAPFSASRISIDPVTLDDGLEATKGTDFKIATARRNGAIVDFGVRKINAAVVIIFGRDGKSIPVGSTVALDEGEAGTMGYDGEVFLRDLKAFNRITIDLGPDGKCSASFPYSEKDGAQPRIGPLTCA